MAIISYARKFIFVHIPKCGGSSIEEEWLRHALPADIITGNAPGDEVLARKYKVAMHATYSEMAKLVGEQNITTFETCAIVREPRTIVESFYRYGKMVARNIRTVAVARNHLSVDGDLNTFISDNINSLDGDMIPKWLSKLNNGVGMEAVVSKSFDEFLERTLDSRWSRYLRGYTNGKSDDVISVKQVLKLEEPIAVRKYFRAKCDKTFTLNHSNKGLISDVIWPAASLTKFYDIAQDEYAAFGYEIKR
jgi:hypothetical protein